MARFRCHDCHAEGTFVYDGRHRDCPNCNSPNVQTALAIEELGDDDPIIVALTKIAEEYDTED